MMMAMLDAGGLRVWTDGRRAADAQSPHGYYELERIKDLDKPLDKEWVREGRGRAVKIVSPLLAHLPADNTYHVIFMRRDLDEVLASQDKMLAGRGQPGAASSTVALKAAYEAHLRTIERLLDRDPRFLAIEVAYQAVIEDPVEMSRRIEQFLGCRLDLGRMAAAVDVSLYRNRHAARRSTGPPDRAAIDIENL